MYKKVLYNIKEMIKMWGGGGWGGEGQYLNPKHSMYLKKEKETKKSKKKKKKKNLTEAGFEPTTSGLEIH